MREEVLAHHRAVSPTGCLQALAATIGEAGIGATRVVFAAAPSQQLVALQPVHQACEAAARKLGLLGEIAHAHLSGRGVHQVLEHLVGAELQPVLALQATLQALGERGMGAQQTAPGAQLSFAEVVLLPECLLLPRSELQDCRCGCCGGHDGNRH